MKKLLIVSFLLSISLTIAQTDRDFYQIIDAVSSQRIAEDIQTLVNFGTRHTLSDTLSKTRGIGAARRWIKNEFETISNNCS
ncbi:MAG: peptidase M28, partial [Rhodobacteraceae bacterium]|nr:peptidase M28 [Paracoccaceae bacterium]